MDEWAVDLPGSPSIVPLARQWVGEVLKELPAEIVYDLQLIASEFATNCIRHSVASDGETVHLRIQRHDDLLRLEVEDGGDLGRPEGGWTGEEAGDFGRGLQVVAQTADVMGDETTTTGGRLAWAELKL